MKRKRIETIRMVVCHKCGAAVIAPTDVLTENNFYIVLCENGWEEDPQWTCPECHSQDRTWIDKFESMGFPLVRSVAL